MNGETSMRRQTRTMLLNITTAIALALAAAVVFLPAAALAEPQPEPEPEPGIDGGFDPGPDPGPDPGMDPGSEPAPDPGTPEPQPEPDPFDPGFGFDFGIQIGGDDPVVCFYSRPNQRGSSFCLEPGDRVSNLGEYSDWISSIENPYGLRVTVCTRRNFDGACGTVRDSADYLGDFDDEISSIRVRD